MAKDELIAQLRQAIEELQRKLTVSDNSLLTHLIMYTLQDTEERLLQATTAHAAEKVCVNLSTTESCHILY